MKEFEEFKKRVMHQKDSLFANLFLNPFTIRIAYLIKKYDLNITPNQVTLTRLFILSPIIILLLFLAPILGLRILYLIITVLFYLILLTDWLDGTIARGLNKTSEKGEFLDSIADRTAVIIFFTLIISIGLFTQTNLLIYGGIFLFVLKTFNLMVISKIFYSDIIPQKQMDSTERYKDKNMQKIFGGDDLNKMGMVKFTSFFEKLNKYLKIEGWNPRINAPERYFLTIMVPSLLIFFKLETIAIYLLGVLTFAFMVFFIIRTKNLLKDYL